MEYETVIGLEVHVQVKTVSKMFCGCAASFGAPPNTHVCPVCLGYPGALPVMNEEAIRLCVTAGLLLGCRINPYSKFDRKNYFYPDMPKNYQISQYDQPLCLDGQVPIVVGNTSREVKLTRIHQEEDVAKNTHAGRGSLIDYNRAGVPLMEIVSEPDMHSPDEAFAFLIALKQILQYGNISDCNLEQGNMRCDVNCSVRPRSTKKLGTKTEIKNLNTFKGVQNALASEIGRQIQLLRQGGTVIQETRRWDADLGLTQSMRTKEEAHDYRYFPDPDLMPVVLSQEKIEHWRASLPELPAQRLNRFMREYGLPEYDAGVLVADKAVADYYEAAAALTANYKAASNWIMTEMLRALSESETVIDQCLVTPAALAALLDMSDKNEINSTAAKEIFNEIFAHGGDPREITAKRNLIQESDTDKLQHFADQAIDRNPKSVEDYRNGKKAALQFLMGQVMRLSKGKANPRMVQELLKNKLAN